MKPARFEQAPESVPPALVRPGENPALDAALARLRQKEAAGPPAHGAGAGAAAGAAAGAVAGAPRRRRRPALGWWLVGLSALAIAGTVVVMVLAVVGSRRQAPAEAALGRPAPSAAPAPPSAAPAAPPSPPAPAARLAASARPAQAPSASAPAVPVPAPLPTRTMKPVDPALNE